MQVDGALNLYEELKKYKIDVGRTEVNKIIDNKDMQSNVKTKKIIDKKRKVNKY